MLDFSRFQVLTFDCYGTLIDWESGIFSALRPILSAHNKELSDQELLRLYSDLEAEAERGNYQTYRSVLEFVVRGLGNELRFDPTPAEAASLANSVSDWKPFPDTIDALNRLASKYSLGIISNIDDDIFSVTKTHLRVNFDFVVTAQQARAYKPSLEIFKLAESRVGFPREQWLHVGQSVYHDVIPAQSIGLSTVWVNRPSPRPAAGAAKAASGKPDIVVPDLATLARIAGA